MATIHTTRRRSTLPTGGVRLRVRASQFVLLATLVGVTTATAAAQPDTKAAPGRTVTRPPLAVTLEDDGATITIGGEVFTRYLVRSGNRPVLWPIIGPTEKPVTRAYPVTAAAAGEERDHPHHRSLWFGYEGVNGCDFWHGPEPGVTRNFEFGTQQHREFLRADSDGRTAVVATRNDWLNASGDAVAHDERMIEFGADRSGSRWIDYRIRLWSSHGPLVIGDTKEGAFALRVASPMRIDSGRGGHIVTSREMRDGAMWAHEAEWVDYYGPLSFDEDDKEIVGIAMMSHPTSYHPTPRWHVRGYGLFAANPFGEVGYTGDVGFQGDAAGTNSAGANGGITVPEGESLRLRYRVFIHRGDAEAADVAAAYARFAKSP